MQKQHTQSCYARWKGNDLTYFDTCLPFGSRHGTQIFQRLSDAIGHMMHCLGFDVINYIDDFVGVGTPSVARPSYDTLIELLQKLGLEVSSKKLVPLSTKATCLGIEIDSEQCTVAIPQDKLRQISDMVEEWSQAKFCSRCQLQSLLGNLLYLQKCIKPSRIFLNRMLELLRQNYDKNSITLTISKGICVGSTNFWPHTMVFLTFTMQKLMKYWNWMLA